MLRAMQHRMALVIALSALTLSAAGCGKKKEGDAGKAGGTAASGGGDKAKPAPAAAPVGDKKLEKLGVTAQLPADAIIDEGTMDAGGIQATVSYGEMSNFFISNVNDMSDNYDRTVKNADAKELKIQEKGADGSTWKLEWTKADMMDATKTVYGVAVRAKVGDKLYDCGSNGLSEAQATELLKVCTTLK
jgi:hypothetical protein